MGRMRTIKPEAASSETLALVPRQVRWTFGLLWTHCDDQGRCVYNPKLIKAAIYPLDDDVTAEVVRAEIDELEQIGAVCVYEVDGRQYLHVPAWSDHQRPNRPLKSKLPPCPGCEFEQNLPPRSGSRSTPTLITNDAVSTHDAISDDAVSTHGAITDEFDPSSQSELGPSAPLFAVTADAVSPHDTVTADAVPVVVVGEGVVTNICSAKPSELDPDPFAEFTAFWDVYPLHVSKLKARERWEKLVTSGVPPGRIIDGAATYANQVRGQDRRHVKHPDGWLLGRRWEDEALTTVGAGDPDRWDR